MRLRRQARTSSEELHLCRYHSRVLELLRCDCECEITGKCGEHRNCGKGEPMQTIGTGHGAAPGRFRNVRVGVFR
jgi:hypothetical protein